MLSNQELAILRTLNNKFRSAAEETIAEISDIAVGVGSKDSEEVLRALYTLEGKSLVEPEPRGDFTSNKWKITNMGMRALQIIEA